MYPRTIKISRKKGPVRANKTTIDGINFASGLEAYMYNALKKANIKNQYEGKTFTLFPEFVFDKEAYERCANGKGEYKNRGNKKVLGIKYTPDFIGNNFIIECKGRANDAFPLRWKMFKRFVHYNLKNITLYKPQNQKECDMTISLILAKAKT
jgi:hypothetical protein